MTDHPTKPVPIGCWHFILTLNWQPVNAFTWADGLIAPQGRTRAQLFDSVFSDVVAQQRRRPPNLEASQPTPVFVSLEPNDQPVVNR